MRILRNFITHESFGGILLLFATILALIFANGPLAAFYGEILHSDFSVSFRDFSLSKPLLLWVNDGLMAIFFFVVGLELKREIVQGELSRPSQIALPIIGALGGVITPALIFWAFNHDDPFALRGWAIPTATDIAFAIGVLMLLGSRVAPSLKIFLLTLAIIDDLCAIAIIAVFYTAKLSLFGFISAAICLGILFALNRLKIATKSLYIFITIILWLSVLNSGVHATIAGVLAAFFIPLKDKNGGEFLRSFELSFSGLSTYFILPIFAFVNAGVAFNADAAGLLNSVSLGIFFGLFLGKQFGIFIFSFLFIKFGFAKLPQNATWTEFYGICILGGIGFTMSLFVDSLAYQNSDIFAHADKLAILFTSLISGLFGYIYLRFFCAKISNKNMKKPPLNHDL